MITIQNEKSEYLEIKKSKFIGYTFFVTNKDMVEDIISKIKLEHKDAKHIVYACNIYPNIQIMENSSEPTGTAGTPILSSIEKRKLNNVLVVVVRYFGGILLGAGGLFRAYNEIANMVIEKSGQKILNEYSFVKNVLVDFKELNDLKYLASASNDILLNNIVYGEKICVDIAFKTKCKLLDDLIEKNKKEIESIWL